MPRGLNKVMIIGNLGHAPELRYTAGGQAVTSLSVAVNRLGRDQAGNRVEVTEWFRVVAWERLAETCAEYLTKGARVFVVMWTKRVYCHLVALVKAHGRAPDRCWFSW